MDLRHVRHPMELQQPTGDEAARPAPEIYNVQLDAYRGPLDLLLYLIRQAEVDIYHIPIAEITAQYLAHIDLMREVNITVAGEFVLMAATLMEIKSKMLLPRTQLDDLDEPGAEDPRAELVRQLLEYKRFKDAARVLEDAQAEQSKKFSRPPLDSEPGPGAPPEEEDVFAGVSLWDLLTAFSKVLKETSLSQPHTIYQTDKPLKYYMTAVLQSLREQGRLRFRELFVDLTDRAQVIGVFLALLELVRLRRATVQQARQFGEIYLTLSEEDSDEELPDDDALGYVTGGHSDGPSDDAYRREAPSEKEDAQ